MKIDGLKVVIQYYRGRKGLKKEEKGGERERVGGEINSRS